MLFPPLLLLLPLAAGRSTPSPSPLAEKVVFKTEDRFTLTGDFRPARGLAKGGRSPAVLLVHDGGGGRADLASIGDALAGMKIASLALDLRGHGDSKKVDGADEPYEWKKEDMTGKKPFLKMPRDLRAGLDWLKARDDVDGGKIGVLGLGTGGAIGLSFATGQDPVRAAIYVSPPGFVDRGYDLTAEVKRIGSRAVLLVCDKANQKTADDLKKFAAQAKDTAPVEVLVAKEKGSGADLLKSEKGLDQRLATWLREKLLPPAKKP
jgi:dienelactone hydrolase